MKKKSDSEQLTLAGTEEGEILARLNDRVERAIAMIQELRKERDTLRASLDQYDRFRGERSEIRKRIESILSSLEGLDDSDQTAD